MFQFFNRLIEPSNLLLGPTYSSLQFWGLILENHRFFYYVLHILGSFGLCTQYVALWPYGRNLETTLRNVCLTMLGTLCILKAATFIFWQKSWTKLINYISRLEVKQISERDRMTFHHIDEYTKHSKKVTRGFRFLIVFTLLLGIVTPLFKILTSPVYQLTNHNISVPYPPIIRLWVPFDQTKGLGYWVVFIEQILLFSYGSSVVSSFDCNAVIIMSFFAGQLKILSANCVRLCGDVNERVNYDEVMRRIKMCHYHHLYLVKYSSLFNSLLKPIMFLYTIICSAMICTTAIQYTAKNIDYVHQMWAVEYILSIVVQLFMYCWHGNQVLYLSNSVESNVYCSAWWSQNVRVRRNLLLLGGQLRKSIRFTAGPFTNIDVANFLTILKASYSYYTVLATKKK